MAEKKIERKCKNNVVLKPSCTSISIQGGRSKNEDTADYKPLDNKTWGRIIFCMVADGHGGVSVSKLLKKEVLPHFTKYFEEYNKGVKKRSIAELDNIMLKSLKNTNTDLQALCKKQDITGGSTLVGVFAFIHQKRVYVLNVGDSRFMMFETKSGEIIGSLRRKIDLEDMQNKVFNQVQPTVTALHKVLGKIRIKDKCPHDLQKMDGVANTWNEDYIHYLQMNNDTPDQRGLREYRLFLNNKETNPTNAMQFVGNRTNDDELVIGNRQLPSTTRAFGDIGMTLHMGEVYMADIPVDRETAIFVGCDGFEESIKLIDIPKYLATPKKQFNMLLSADHKFVSMYTQYKDWFIHQKIGHFPKSGIQAELNWLMTCIQKVGHSHLPSKRD
eukprot:UN31083